MTSQGNPSRHKKSVVTMSLVGHILNGDRMQMDLKEKIKILLDMDMPMVGGAGNKAKLGGRKEVDTVPTVSSWVGDHQRKSTIIYFCFASFLASCSFMISLLVAM
jgi:hypothetical protein